MVGGGRGIKQNHIMANGLLSTPVYIIIQRFSSRVTMCVKTEFANVNKGYMSLSEIVVKTGACRGADNRDLFIGRPHCTFCDNKD